MTEQHPDDGAGSDPFVEQEAVQTGFVRFRDVSAPCLQSAHTEEAAPARSPVDRALEMQPDGPSPPEPYEASE